MQQMQQIKVGTVVELLYDFFDGNLVGSSVANPTDVTIADITFDGNSSNNLLMFTLDIVKII